jgi:hypothetical protein
MTFASIGSVASTKSRGQNDERLLGIRAAVHDESLVNRRTAVARPLLHPIAHQMGQPMDCGRAAPAEM